jgi:hypothetical protein
LRLLLRGRAKELDQRVLSGRGAGRLLREQGLETTAISRRVLFFIISGGGCYHLVNGQNFFCPA